MACTFQSGENMINGVEYRSFTQDDWDGWSGAEPFDDGAEPLVATCYIRVNEEARDYGSQVTYAGTIIADKMGVHVWATDDEGEIRYAWDSEGHAQANRPHHHSLCMLRGLLTFVRDNHLPDHVLDAMFARVA